MTTLDPGSHPAADDVARHVMPAPVVDVVVPAYNEERDVHIRSTAMADLRGIWRLIRANRWPVLPGLRRARGGALGHQVRTFATIGLLSTISYAVLFALLRVATPAHVANGVALVVTAVGNTAANRRLTFEARDRATLVRDHLAGLTAFAAALAITTTAVGLLGAVAPDAGWAAELAVLVAANAVATVARFALLRAWIFHDREPASSSTSIRLERTVS